MSSNKLTTARYLLKQVQIRRLKLLGVGPEFTSNQLAEYKMCEKAIKELEHILDKPSSQFKEVFNTWAQSKVNPDHLNK